MEHCLVEDFFTWAQILDCSFLVLQQVTQGYTEDIPRLYLSNWSSKSIVDSNSGGECCPERVLTAC